MTELYNKVAHKTSKFTTNTYTTSFSFGILFLRQNWGPIYDIWICASCRRNCGYFPSYR